MTPLIDNTWNLLQSEYNKYDNPNFKFNTEKEETFKRMFTEKYHHIMKEYMDESVDNLDRHKVAALIIVSILETEAISFENLEKDYIFIGAELLALRVGLAYMLKKLNEKLAERGVDKTIEEFTFPTAQSCPTPYMEIMCRNLYYAKTDFKLNPLDLAERLFLVENIMLIKEGIDPDILKEY